MNTTNNLKSLKVSLEDLYEAKDKQINISLSDKPYTFIVSLKSGFSIDMVDCLISSWGANLFFRTPKGMKFEKYKTIGTLERAIIKYVEKYVDTKGTLTFSISNEVYRM